MNPHPVDSPSSNEPPERRPGARTAGSAALNDATTPVSSSVETPVSSSVETPVSSNVETPVSSSVETPRGVRIKMPRIAAAHYAMPDPTVALTDKEIMKHIPGGSRVLDLGCGDGRLLEILRDAHGCRVQGIELSSREIVGCIGRGVPVIHGDLDRGLPEFPDDSFDYAVLSQTLQQVKNPKRVLEEIVRIARRALVVVPNFGYWKVRWQHLMSGRAPITESLPYEWFNTPNLHFMSMLDFRDLVTRLGIRVLKELPIIKGRAVDRAWAANLRAGSALYVLERPGTAASARESVRSSLS